MEKQYFFPPVNWPEVSDGMIIGQNEILRRLLRVKIWFFYDTCALMHHSHPGGDFVISYIVRNQGAVILPQTIILELSSLHSDHAISGSAIHEMHAGYIRRMIDKGIPVIFLPEEKCTLFLQDVMTLDRKERNEQFVYVIRHLRSRKRGIARALDLIPESDRKKLLTGKNISGETGEIYIPIIRNQKQTGDRLGEEMIFYCMMMLSRLCVPMSIISDDQRAFDGFIHTASYIEKHYHRKDVQYYSTVHLCHLLYKQGFLGEENIMGFLETAYKNAGKVSFRGMTSKDFMPREQTVSIREMAELIRNDMELRILI